MTLVLALSPGADAAAIAARVKLACGIAPEVDAKRRFSVKFYQVAVLFVVFDVEVAFLFPWAVLFRSQEGMTFFVEMLIFLTILAAGLYYIIKRGALEWE